MIFILLIKKGDKIILEGKEFIVGGNIEVIEGDFKGLKGKIIEILTAEDKETENENDDIYVCLEEPEDETLRNKINENIRVITNGVYLNMNEFGIDLVILSPSEVKPID